MRRRQPACTWKKFAFIRLIRAFLRCASGGGAGPSGRGTSRPERLFQLTPAGGLLRSKGMGFRDSLIRPRAGSSDTGATQMNPDLADRSNLLRAPTIRRIASRKELIAKVGSARLRHASEHAAERIRVHPPDPRV